MAAAGAREEEVAAILCGLRSILRARDRRRRRRDEAAPGIPSWGRRRLRSMLGDGKAAAAAAGEAAERGGGAASPDTPLAFFPESGGEQEAEEDANKATAQAEWAQEQRGVVAALSQEKTHLLKEIEEYAARLQSTRTTNESLKQLHQVRQNREQQARLLRMVVVAPADPRYPALALGLGLDLNEPAPRAPEEEARAAAVEEWYRRGQLVQRAAVAASARRRRLEYLRAKVASPLVSCRARRVAG